MAATQTTNASITYYLNTAFEYEIRNRLDIDVQRLQQLTQPSELEKQQLERLLLVRDYLNARRAELKA